MSSARLGEAAYLAVALLVAGLSLLAARRPTTLGSAWSALRSLQHHPAGRWLVLAAWAWLGWHLFDR